VVEVERREGKKSFLGLVLVILNLEKVASFFFRGEGEGGWDTWRGKLRIPGAGELEGSCGEVVRKGGRGSGGKVRRGEIKLAGEKRVLVKVEKNRCNTGSKVSEDIGGS